MSIRTAILCASASSLVLSAAAFADETAETAYEAEPNTAVQRDYVADRPVPADPEILVRDDVGLGGSFDAADLWPSVVQMFIQNNANGGVFFNCTGSLVNARTVLTAAHCLNDSSSEAYGLPGQSPLSVLIGFGPDTSTRLFTYLGSGAGYREGGVATSTDVIIHPSANVDNGGLPFPWADVALIALDEPVSDVPTLPMLFTPLDQLTHVVQLGYGTFGTAETGGQGIGFRRLVGENMLGMLGSPADLADGIFPGLAPTALTFGFETQPYYFTDFDNPFRTEAETNGCSFTGTGISCDSLAAVRAIDYFTGDALPNEVATAGGDSGSPLIADEIADMPLIIGVLSGGFDFFGVPEGYGDISFYNPLFPFYEFISANTPYKYVSAKRGFGFWSDPTHWTQDLDPNFFIIDESGQLQNGLPQGPEPGVFATGPKVGDVLGDDVSDNPDIVSPFLPPEGTPDFGGDLPNSSVLTGPGSTGFVPNNTDGSPGTAFANPAQYFDVLLTQPGFTIVDMDVEIDKLTIDGGATVFNLSRDHEFTSLIGVEQYRGFATIDGVLNAGNVLLMGGFFGGEGVINTDAVWNLGAGLTPGGTGSTGELTINGDYIQSELGVMWIDVERRRGKLRSDFVQVNGGASLDGTLLVSNFRGRVRFGDIFPFLNADTLIGDFDNVFLQTRSVTLYAETIISATDAAVEIKARSIEELLGQGNPLVELGAVLDRVRTGGSYNDFADVFDLVDGASFSQFESALFSPTPTNAFTQSSSAVNFSNSFTGRLAQRSAELRYGAAGVSVSGVNATASSAFGFVNAGEAPDLDLGRFGLFVASRSGGIAAPDAFSTQVLFNPDGANFSDDGEITIGADYRLRDNTIVGLAVTAERQSFSSQGVTPLENESYGAAAYATTHGDAWFVDAHYGYAKQDFAMERRTGGDLSETLALAYGAPQADQTLAGLRAGWAFEPALGFTVGPVMSVNYVNARFDSYRELAGGAFNLDVEGRSLTSVAAELGASARYTLRREGGVRFDAFGEVAYAQELADNQDTVTAAFVDAPGERFSLDQALAQSWTTATAGINADLSPRLGMRFELSSDFNRGPLDNQTAFAAVNWRF